MKEADVLLNYLEENLDEAHIKNVETLHLDAIAYKPVPFLPLTMVYPENGLKQFLKEEAMEDPEKMLYNELLSTIGGTGAYYSAKLKDHFPPQIRSNHGIGILSSLFGARCMVINNNMPWVEHLEFDKIKEIISHGVPGFDQALGKKVMETHRHFIDRLKEYPKCFRCIRITQPDLQGPFDIAHLLIGKDIFYGLFDYPDILHELLRIITQTYIGFRKTLDPLLTDHAGEDAVYLHGCIFGGKVLIKDDTAAINLSEEMYREFSGRYNEQIFEAFGGGSLHYCGTSRAWHFESMSNKWLKGINYGNPELHDLNRTFQFWRARKIPNLLWGDLLCGYRQEHDLINEVRQSGITTGMSLVSRAKNYEEAEEILKAHCGGAI